MFSISHFKFYVSLLAICCVFLACQRDEYYTGQDVDLKFSLDTLRFDTVFTSLGSATRSFKIYNPKDQPILVDVNLKRISNNFFRINVDGNNGPTVSQVEINGNDSIYVFVEVKINPDQDVSISPFVIEDQIEITVNNTKSTIILEAWGQNANYIPNSKLKSSQSILSCDLGKVIWNDPKPYVIYGILYIDSCTLVLPPGVKLYVHGGVVIQDEDTYNAGIIVFLKDGKLESNGTIDQPVIIQGDRLEEEYKDVKSQWTGIFFIRESKGNILRHTEIKNSIIGLSADSLCEFSMYNSKVFNTGRAGIRGRASKIYGENCLIYGNGGSSLEFTFGGDYVFNYCSIGSYEGQTDALVLRDFTCDDFLCQKRRNNKLNARFTNCIFAGGSDDEISLSQNSINNNDFDYKFDHCAVKVKELLTKDGFPDFFDNCVDCLNLKSNDKLYLKNREGDFRLDTMSVALGKGKNISSIQQDILGKVRKSIPDMGCYEF